MGAGLSSSLGSWWSHSSILRCVVASNTLSSPLGPGNGGVEFSLAYLSPQDFPVDICSGLDSAP